ncbi:MAG TPA: hypothetical protein VKA08_03075 [Balneolales bacterium]|jgi:hypothetical protein|nr:hypothetical protein [Balneolales bacterium]
MKKLTAAITMTFLVVLSVIVNAQAQSEKPYTEGTVWSVQYVQTKSGMGETYLKDLSENWVKVVKEAQKEGLIMSYKVLSAQPSAKTDWDLMLLIQFKNYADLDGLSDKMDAIAKKVIGNQDKQHKDAINRNDMRTLLGGKLAQELIFK